MDEMIGADVAALDDLARRVEAHAREVDQAARAVDSIVARMSWHGPVADEFRTRWRGSTRIGLHDTAARFHQLSRALREEADQQRRASSGASGGNGLMQGLSSRVEDVTGTASAVGRDLERELDGLNEVLREVNDTAARELDHVAERAKDAAVRNGLTTVLPILFPQIVGTAYLGVRSAALVADVVEERTGVDMRAPARWVAREALGRGVSDRSVFEDVGSGDFPVGYSGAEALSSLDTQELNTVKILQTGDPNHPRFLVMLRGIDLLDWDPADVNTPPQAVLQELLHGGAYEEAVREAMQRAGIPPGSEIAFIAWSQGGMTAMDLAADPEFNTRYEVTHVLTTGSPAQDMFDNVRRSNADVQMLALDNSGDLVAGSDTGDEHRVAGASHVVFTRDQDAFLPHGNGLADDPTGGGYAWMMDRIEHGKACQGTHAATFASSLDSLYFRSPPARVATAHMAVDGGLLTAVMSR